MNGLDDDFPDLSTLSLSAGRQAMGQRHPPRHRAGERFLKGPIPWGWLRAASSRPGRALAVAMAAWFLAGLTKRDAVKLSLSSLAEMGVGRDTARRGLASLEGAGLVAVQRSPGRAPVVTLLDYPAAAGVTPRQAAPRDPASSTPGGDAGLSGQQAGAGDQPGLSAGPHVPPGARGLRLSGGGRGPSAALARPVPPRRRAWPPTSRSRGLWT